MTLLIAALLSAVDPGPCVDQCMKTMYRCHAAAERGGKTASKEAMCACETEACRCVEKACGVPCPVRMWCR